MKKKNIVFFLIGFTVSMIIFLSIRRNINNNIFSNSDKYNFFGLYSVNEVMILSGYNKVSDNSWHCLYNGLDITIIYDYNNSICYKNDYYFFLDNFYDDGEELYISKEELEKILNIDISYIDGKVTVIKKDYSDLDWTKSQVITHAGGAVRESDAIYYYTNSKDALIQNYSLGCRLFEFDMYPTNDDNLAIVHDWKQFGKLDGTYFSTDEWLDFKTGTANVADGKYTTMVIGTLLDEMLINPDIFIITDTKSTEFSKEIIKNQFEIIYREAIIRDSKLLNRIIPQIYNEEMYDIVQSVYKFPNLIFTCYATEEPGNEIVDFCINHEEFKAITAPYTGGKITIDDIYKLHKHNLKLYYHTIYTHAEMVESFKNGADGIYTGIFTPNDVESYERALDIEYNK